MSINNYEHRLIVDNEYLDVYGHVNHAHYLTLFEDARWGYYQTKDISPESVKSERIGPVVLKADISYRKEITTGEKIIIRNEHMGYKRNLWHLRQTMHKEDGKIASSVDLIFAIFDLNQRKMIPPFGKWIED